MELQIIWFFLWGLLWAVFFMTDGFDFGIGTLYPFLGRTDDDRRIMINSMGPLWDGNEVWLLTAGGVTFAAFPKVYSVMFSALYAPLMLILFALIIRGVSFEFRSKVSDPRWRHFWDWCIFIGSAAPALLFGVAFANIFRGIPIDGQGLYHGHLLLLLNPYGLAGGVLFMLMFLVHGSLWLSIRTEGDLQHRAARIARALWPAELAAAVIFLIATALATDLYGNYLARPWLFLVIAVTVAALVALRFFIGTEAWGRAWLASAGVIVGATFFGVIGLFPRLLPSNMDPTFHLTAYNASSSPLTLKIMLAVVVIFIPIVIGYQIWAYRLFLTKVTRDDLYADNAY